MAAYTRIVTRRIESNHVFLDAALPNEVPTDSRSFIVKLWQDGDASRSQGSGWRGRITSVPNGERFYVRKPDDLPTLLAWQIGRSGIRLGWYWCLKVAFHVWRQRWMKGSRR